jgi:hypothetical protein
MGFKVPSILDGFNQKSHPFHAICLNAPQVFDLAVSIGLFHFFPDHAAHAELTVKRIR